MSPIPPPLSFLNEPPLTATTTLVPWLKVLNKTAPPSVRNEQAAIDSLDSYDLWMDFQNNYSQSEILWGCCLVCLIVVVNSAVLWVVSRSRELWKPRHLWMACLCITDLGVGAHKMLELLLVVWPQYELCVLQRTTLGIPYVVNMLLLTMLSLDRFVAVVYPFFYSATVSNKHVFVGFGLVLLTGAILATASVGLGLRDDVCRPQSLQLVYLTVVLTICSLLTLLFNSSVLRIAKKQLHAIYSTPLLNTATTRRVSLFCTHCGHKNAAFVNTFGNPKNAAVKKNTTPDELGNTTSTSASASSNSSIRESPPPEYNETRRNWNETGGGPAAVPEYMAPELKTVLGHHLALSPLALALPPLPFPAAYHMTRNVETPPNPNPNPLLKRSSANLESSPLTSGDCSSEQDFPSVPPSLFRTLSLPAIPENLALIIPPDPIVPVAAIHVDGSTLDMMKNTIKINSSLSNIQSQINIMPSSAPPITVGLPRSRSFTCSKNVSGNSTTEKHQHLLRNFQFGRSHVFHVGRLFPSIRFARTVLLIMIPMWVFILPIVTIIPLHRGCSAQVKSDLDCQFVNKLWAYLLIHIRSVLPLQAIIDTLIYAFGSKEFRHAFQKISDWSRRRKRLREYQRAIAQKARLSNASSNKY